MELEVRFLFHLPDRTREGNSASLMVATGLNVSINTIIGLLFMKLTGMILDLLGKVVDCKYLNSPPFPVDFRRTSNHVPIMDKLSSTPANHAVSYNQMIQEVENLECYYEPKLLAGGLTMNPKALANHCGSRLAVRATVIDHNGSNMASHSTADMSARWVPPKGLPRITAITKPMSLGRTGYCELQPVGQCNICEHSLHRTYVVAIVFAALVVIGYLNPIRKNSCH